MRKTSLILLMAVGLLLPAILTGQNFSSYGGTIPNNSTGNCFNLQVAGVGALSGSNGLVRVCLSIDQARPADMDITLVSPSGVVVSLSTDNGGTSGNDYYEGLCFSDCGPSGPISSGSNFRGVYTPENSIATFNDGSSGDGTWSLCIDDDNAFGGDGILNYWSLDFGSNTPPAIPSGEDCANALVLNNLPFSHTCMTLAGSSNDYNSCTGIMGGADYIYAYTPAGPDEYLSIDIAQDYFAPSGFPTVVLLDTCPDLAFPRNCIQTEIQMNSSENILNITSQPLNQGKTYYIVAASTSGTGGTYDMRIASGLNGNPDCLNATPITYTGEYAGNNYAAPMPNAQAPSTAEMACNGSIDNFVFYTFTTDAVGSTVYVNVTDIDCDVSCGGSCGIQLALFEEPTGGPCLGPGSWGAPIHCESSTQTNAYYAWSGLSPNTNYYLMVDGNAGSSCVWNLRAMGDFSQTLLPVDFLRLDAVALGLENRISWSTENEVNASHFEIEHSTSLPHFESVGTELAAGSALANYEYLHPVAEAGMHYYRIKNVDIDGNHSYSDIASVWVEGERESLGVFPNPAQERLTVQFLAEEGAALSIMDLGGRELKKLDVNPAADLRQVKLDISDLPTGIYLLKVQPLRSAVQIKQFSKI